MAWGGEINVKYLVNLQLTGITFLFIRVIDYGDGSHSKPTNPMTTGPATV